MLPWGIPDKTGRNQKIDYLFLRNPNFAGEINLLRWSIILSYVTRFSKINHMGTKGKSEIKSA